MAALIYRVDSVTGALDQVHPTGCGRAGAASTDVLERMVAQRQHFEAAELAMLRRQYLLELPPALLSGRALADALALQRYLADIRYGLALLAAAEPYARLMEDMADVANREDEGDECDEPS